MTEQDYLKKVLTEISNQLQHAEKVSLDLKGQLGETQRNMWNEVAAAPSSNTDMDQIVQAQAYLNQIETQNRQYHMALQAIKKLTRMINSPYFGRIDFRENGQNESEPLYIGIGTISEQADINNFLVYDWRAPICSMYYDYEIGEASYTCPEGEICGEIELKRQYRIVHGLMQLMFDSAITIDDEILQEALSHSSNSKMKTIVTTIQREQNKIIRDDTHSYLIVNGPAGCGKTSVALHRVAWLLYKHRDYMKSENILVLSPNDIFNDYISNVLPELGEQNMKQMTYHQLMKTILGNKYYIGNFNTQMEMILTDSIDIMPESIKFKSSNEFYKIIETYLEMLESTPIAFKDITVKEDVIIPAEDLIHLYRYELSYLPIKKRIDKIKQRILKIIDEKIGELAGDIIITLAETGNYVDKADLTKAAYEQARLEFIEAIEYAENDIQFSAYDTYMNLFYDISLIEEIADECGVELPDNIESILEFSYNQLELNMISHEDATPLALIKTMAGDVESTKEIKHIVIDEGQDYTPLQMQLICKYFDYAGITLLGDPGQAINPLYSTDNFTDFDEALQDGKLTHIKLNKSYRPTVEINHLTSKILDLDIDIENINRHGFEPTITEFSDSANYEKIITHILSLLEKYERQGHRSIAIICNNQIQANQVYKLLHKYTPLKLISDADESFTINTCVIPIYLAKGLEYDAVIVFDASEDSYPNDSYRKLLYTACTRALHSLDIMSLGKKTHLLD